MITYIFTLKSIIWYYKVNYRGFLNSLLLIYWQKIPLSHFFRSKNKYEQY